MKLRSKISDIRNTGRNTKGVRLLRLREKDYVITAVQSSSDDINVVSDDSCNTISTEEGAVAECTFSL